MASASSTNRVRTDPLRNFKFQVQITKTFGLEQVTLARAGFMAVSGLSVSNEMIPYREGGMNTTPRKLPGQTDFPPIQLSRGTFTGAGVGQAQWYWFRELFFHSQGGGAGLQHNNFRTDFIIRLLSHPTTQDGESGDFPSNAALANGNGNLNSAQVVWKVYNAWPQALSYSDLDAGGNAVSVTSMSLVHEGWDVSHAVAGADSVADITA